MKRTRPSATHKVAHKDGDGFHNHKDNLRWATGKENEDDKRKHGRRPHLLTEDEVKSIRRMISAGAMSTKIASAYSVHPTTIADIKFRRTWVWLD